MDFKTLLEKDFIFLDGGFGTELQRLGMEPGENPVLLNVKNPEMIKTVISSYVEAGSDIVTANTFGCNSYKLAGSGYKPCDIIPKALEIAKECAGDKALVALDLSPVGKLCEPNGTMTFEEAYEYYKEQIVCADLADVIFLETQTDLYELKAGVLAARENSDKPILCSMTFEESGRTFTGCDPISMITTLEGLGVSALGLNCSRGPDELMDVIKEFSKYCSLPIIVKPNAGLPDPVTGLYSTDAETFVEQMAKTIPLGAKIVGGCCGTKPEYISLLKKCFENERYQKNTPEQINAVCSNSKTVVISCPRIIGERINPTGKKRFKEALLANDIDYILAQAIEQADAGADILDVNVGLPGVDEKEMMVRVVKAIQGINDLPLQIDSTNPEVIEAALRIYNGKAIVNSVNGEEKSLSTVLPIVKKYSAAVVGLALDENGIPKSADERFEIAKKILNRARELGIPDKDVYIDCLTLTASAEQEGVMQTLEALGRVHNELGLKTVLGVSNISFGLPNRPLVNQNFLTMALTYGLDLPIINPNIEGMSGAVRAFKLLKGYDKNSTEFIASYSGDNSKAASKPQSNEITLSYAVSNGLKSEAKQITQNLLSTKEPLEIVNGELIPILDKAGDDFEKGKIFLPQLILAASGAQACFEVIKNELSKTQQENVSKGRIIIATVKGDVHDIGKNIVKVILQNYGFDVIDLGKDVPPEVVVDTAIKENIKLVGLSALMTTTLGAMEETIKLLKAKKPDTIVWVGGAVLTPEYAKKIGADYYTKDAKESADLAKKIFSE
ncbi:MAG: homocysteine S-methyltransferase family protein [Ruminococcus sp.]|nr:homocysteine S-methyltransferase family protein [Ruminococcus sp.]